MSDTPPQDSAVPFGRRLLKEEIGRIWTIDRSEIVEAVYYLDKGSLVLKPEYHDVRGWPEGEAQRYTRMLEACHDRGGWFWGLFHQARLVGIAVLDALLIGKHQEQLQLVFLHVSRPHRRQGLGRHLFRCAARQARQRGARRLYISATPSRHSVDFYLRLGCTLLAEPDPRLFELEPDDIHLEYDLGLLGVGYVP